MSLGRQAPRPLSLALESFTAAVAPASTLARVQACWESAVGAAIAAAAAPIAERDGVLTVRCEAAVWSQELELMAAELLDPPECRPRRGAAAQAALPRGLTDMGRFPCYSRAFGVFGGAGEGPLVLSFDGQRTAPVRGLSSSDSGAFSRLLEMKWRPIGRREHR